MSFLLNLIPAPYRLLAEIGIVATLIALGALWLHHDRSKHEAIGEARVQAKWDAATVKQQTEALALAQSNAKETLRRIDRQQEAQHENDQEVTRYQRVSADSVAVRDSLRQRTQKLASLASGASSNPAAGLNGKTAAAAAGMLTELSGGADAMAEIYARQADASRRAGIFCEREYDALKR